MSESHEREPSASPSPSQRTAAAPAAARTPVAAAAFDLLELQGGGRVTVRNGATQSVTLVRGNLETTRFTVRRDGKLEIDACGAQLPGL